MVVEEYGNYTDTTVTVPCYNCSAKITLSPAEIYYLRDRPHFKCPLCFMHILIKEKLPENFSNARGMYSEAQKENARYIPVYIPKK